MEIRKKALVGLLISLLAIGIAYGVMEVLWTRNPTMMVYMKAYGAYLNKYQILTGGTVFDPSEVNEWLRSPTNDHLYDILVRIDVMNQIDVGILRINVSEIPSYLDINISKVEIVYYQVFGTEWLGPYVVTTLASNVPLATEISFNKADVLSGYVAGKIDYQCRFLHLQLSEYQIHSSGGLTEISLTTTIELGIENF